VIKEFDYSANLLRVILWQYNQAERLQAWLENKQNNFDRDNSDFWQDWYQNFFNIESANNFGINLWAIILDLPILIQENEAEIVDSFGFGEYRSNFFESNFYTGDGGSSSILTIEQRRILIKMRYQQLNTQATIPQINLIMKNAWGDLGNSYCIDNYDMTITYFFEFEPPAWIICN